MVLLFVNSDNVGVFVRTQNTTCSFADRVFMIKNVKNVSYKTEMKNTSKSEIASKHEVFG